jgi:uncharacterized membrane protein (TIGR02234 family)
MPGKPTAAGRRELALAAAGSVLGSGAVFLAAGRTWLSVTSLRPAPFGPVTSAVTGQKWVPALDGLALVGLLAAVLTVVAGRMSRQLLAVLQLVAAGGSGRLALRGLDVPSAGRLRELGASPTLSDVASSSGRLHPQWPLLATVGAVLLGVGALTVTARSWSWQSGLSRRYDSPVESAAAGDAWHVLDRGGDPTIGDD